MKITLEAGFLNSQFGTRFNRGDSDRAYSARLFHPSIKLLPVYASNLHQGEPSDEL